MTTTKTNTFSFAGLELRSAVIDGKPWFVTADACRMIGLKPTSDGAFTRHAKKLDDHEKRLEPTLTFGGSVRGLRVSIISESGLYKLVMRAQKANPKAAEFQNWVTGTVLPAIRQDGMYVQGEELRSITIEGKPWFVAADVCRTFGASDPAVACRALKGRAPS